MITEDDKKQADEVIQIYGLQKQKEMLNQAIPELEPGMILEYRAIGNMWYEYTKALQDNLHFIPRKLRVKFIEKEKN